MKLLRVERLKNDDKRFVAIFQKDDGKEKRTKFGQPGANNTYLDGASKEVRENYRKRHKRDLRTNDPTRAGYLAMGIIWNKPTLEASIRDYRRRLNIYNKTGTFPTKDWFP